MNIKSEFLSSLISHPKLSSGLPPESFLGHILSPEEDSSTAPLLKLLSCGTITAASPWSFDIKKLDCFLLLYTKNGCGKLLAEGQVYTLSESSLLFWDCRSRFRFDITVCPWEYQILFINGDILSYYYHLLPPKQVPIIKIPASSDTAMDLNYLAGCACPCFFPQKLIISDRLNRIVTRCVTTLLGRADSSTQVFSYIEDIRNLFDNHYQKTYTLDELAEQFGVNKYRLCRDFSAAQGISPLQYLNRQRIRHAASLLLTTQNKVHEIGSMVGIENTNHFIHLFKKFYGITPLEYKDRMVL